MLRLTIWMNNPSFYQSDFFRALVDTGQVDLQIIFAKTLPYARQKLGWRDDVCGYTFRFLTESETTDFRSILNAITIATSQRDRLHIVNGIWAEPTFAAALCTLALCKSRYVIYSEASNPDSKRNFSKRILRYMFGYAILYRVIGVLAVAYLGIDHFRHLGVPEQKIYPFGYFRAHPELAPIDFTSYKKSQKKELIFVGQLIRRKGIDILLEAIAPLMAEDKQLTLTLIGDGDGRIKFQEQVVALGLGEQVVFEGVIPAHQIPSRIHCADALILPSRWDGWGLVVNEALSVGVPVIVSDKCGASDLIKNGLNGYIFQSENVTDLRKQLSRFLKRRLEWPSLRSYAAGTSKEISTDRVAYYLIECIRHMLGNTQVRPIPPWVNGGHYK